MKSTAVPIEDTHSVSAARLQLAVGRLMRTIRQHGATGLTASQISALATIERYGPMRISHLAALEYIGAPAATRGVASLEELGYVERSHDPDDKRACLVQLTASGTAMLSYMWQERAIGLSMRIASLSSEEQGILAAALPVLEKITHDS